MKLGVQTTRSTCPPPLYRLKSEAEIACKFQDAVGRRFQRLDILL